MKAVKNVANPPTTQKPHKSTEELFLVEGRGCGRLVPSLPLCKQIPEELSSFWAPVEVGAAPGAPGALAPLTPHQEGPSPALHPPRLTKRSPLGL